MGSIAGSHSAAGTTENTTNLESFARSVDDAVATLAEKADIAASSLEQFYRYREDLLAWIQEQQASVSRSAPRLAWSGWGWQPFLDNREVRIGLLTVYKNNPIPIHDHPQAVGTLVVMEGTLHARNYQLDGDAESGRLKIAELRMVAEQEFGVRQSAFITPVESNIHSISSDGESCVVLDILLTPYDEARRTWYLPFVDEIQPQQPFTAFCLDGRKTHN